MMSNSEARKRQAASEPSADVEALAWRLVNFTSQCAGLADPHAGVVEMLAAHTSAARAEALLPIRRYAEAAALTAKVRGQNERPWLDLLILCDREDES